MDNKACSNCGTENSSESLICTVCGRVLHDNKKIVEEPVQVKKSDIPKVSIIDDEPKEVSKKDKILGTVIGLIAILIFFGGGFLLPRYIEFGYITPISFVLGIIVGVYGRIKYPRSKSADFSLALIVAFISAVAIGILIAAVSFSSSCSNDNINSCSNTCSSIPD